MVCAASLSFAACGGTGGGGTTGSTIENPWWTTTGSLEKDADNNVVFDNIDIALTTIVDGADKATLNEIVSQFNSEYSGKIRVTVTVAHQGIFDETVASQISNNSNPPDLIMGHQKSYKSFTDMHLLQPFDEVIEESGISISLDDYSSSLSKYSSMGYEGYTFGIPIDAQSCVVYYNKQMLNEYGGELPTSHSELIRLCKKVAAEKNITPIAMSTEDDFFTNYVFTTAIVQNGGVFYDDNYRANWYSNEENRQAFLNGITSLRDLTSQSLADFGRGTSSALNQFLDGAALFYIAMPWDLNSIIGSVANKNGVSTDLAKSQYLGVTSLSNWFALGENSDCGSKIFGDSHFFAMSKTVKNIETKAAICEFVKWFTSKAEVGAEWAEAGHVSASTTILNSNEYQSNETVKNYIGNFYSDINSFECAGTTPFYSILFESINTLFVSVKTGSASNDADYIKTAEDSMNSLVDFAEM